MYLHNLFKDGNQILLQLLTRIPNCWGYQWQAFFNRVSLIKNDGLILLWSED